MSCLAFYAGKLSKKLRFYRQYFNKANQENLYHLPLHRYFKLEFSTKIQCAPRVQCKRTSERVHFDQTSVILDCGIWETRGRIEDLRQMTGGAGEGNSSSSLFSYFLLNGNRQAWP